MKKSLIEKKINILLEKMTLSEKVSLLSGQNAWVTMPIERLGIPSIVLTDGPHGVRTGGAGQGRIVGKATAYPTGVSMASTWDPDLIEEVAEALAEETRSMGCHLLLGPCVNIVRSPLGGRNFETYSEDPYVAGEIGTAYVRGLQRQMIGASVKHYAANNQEIERHRGNSVVDERTLREIYLSAFERIVKEANPWTVMCCYNRVNGVYGSENAHLLRDILKDEWGFEGVVVSDWGAVHNIFKPVEAGLDLEMPGPARYFGRNLEAAVDNWQIDEALVEAAARRVLRMLFRAGVMSDQDLPEGKRDTSEHRALAQRLAAESMVLLKNDNQQLPFDQKEIQKLAVIGMNADRLITGGGSSRVDPHHWVTPLEGLRQNLSDDVEVLFEMGYDNRLQPDLVTEDRFYQRDESSAGLKAEYFNALDFSGKPVLTRMEPIPGDWWSRNSPEVGVVDEKCFSGRWTGTFTAPENGETCFYLMNTGTGRIWLDDELVLENEVGAVTSATIDYRAMTAEKVIPLEKGRVYAFRAEFSSGPGSQFAVMRLAYLPPLGVDGDLAERAVKLASDCDAVVLVAGLPDGFESEGYDRPDMNLPGDQEALIRAVAAVNPRTVVVVNAGSPVEMPWIEAVDAALLAYYPGQEGGHALADLLFGAVNPSGKLTVTFPKRLQDHPAFIHYPGWKDVVYGEGLFVGYRYYDAKDVAPLFPFGHGLSYTTFTYQDLVIPETVVVGENLKVSLTVKNTGARDGKEIVQLYVADQDSRLARPPKELKGFAKVDLAQGESIEVTFELKPRDLSYYDPDLGDWVAEPGKFQVLVGASSSDIRLKGCFDYVEPMD